MCIALLASTEAVVKANPTYHCLSNYVQIDKVYTILNTGSHPGSAAIKKKIRDLKREEGILSTMIANRFHMSMA